MCGGNLEFNEKMTVGACKYCGSTMTLPKDMDESKANLFNRVNHFRRQNDFDKALSAYEAILNIDNSDAEAHWGVVLSRYGIEYVEDPVSHERIPTCHRVQQESIMSDADYLAALENAPDSASRNVYETEAKRISEIQKDILAISAKEEPFDVFICYKETTESRTRSKDSVLAQDIYFHLTQEGFKVFFSRITLEDKLGKAYEPYIFAALNSSKVMVVVGTKPENFNALWVKNEWGRYLALIKKGEKKTLIPAYRDMDPYDLPEEFSNLQAQDMGKIGFIQDLIRGIKKIVLAGEHKELYSNITQTVAQGNVNVDILLERAFIFLEDGNFSSADEYCEKVLDIQPKNSKAYIGKLLAEMKIREESGLALCTKTLDDNNNYQKALRFADTTYKTIILGYNQAILESFEYKVLNKKPGESIAFGKYLQNGYTVDEAEKIKWRILATVDDRAFLISEKCLDCKPYNLDNRDITWEVCSLRKWLNCDFIKSAFNDQEQAQIITTKVANVGIPDFITVAGNNTEDKVFLLSFSEVEKFQKTNFERKACATNYSIANGVFVNQYNNCWWWLRSSGYCQNSAIFIGEDGEINSDGYVDSEYIGVRPALWMHLKSENV